jgi:hypothetical protein
MGVLLFKGGVGVGMLKVAVFSPLPLRGRGEPRVSPLSHEAGEGSTRGKGKKPGGIRTQ